MLEPATRTTATAPRGLAGTAVAGLGTALPATVVGNDAVAARIGKDARWIASRTGIEERRWLAPEERLADLAAEAGRAALADAGLPAAALDLVLVATASADDLVPALAPQVAGLLGAHGAAGLDVGAACTGFLAALELAGAMLEAGRAAHVLVVGAEKLSALTDPEDRGTAMLFADGAGAVVLSRAAGAGDLGPVVLRSEPHRDELYADRERALLVMDGHEVFKHAVARMTEATLEALTAAGLGVGDVDLFVYHQANSRIVRSVGQRLGLDPARVVDSIAAVGNVSAASIPLALAAARADGRLVDGARVLLAAFGAGFVWGAALLDWRAA